ncbi:MAG: lysylphosphatidylglycerol synthase domain-containing protein [Myxococcota bacterium]|nr:lysylphosphatidylglycerol synthase domain-containing protein [Myxococcota bacterium]
MKFFKWGAPFLVSALLLAWIFSDIDFDRILAKLDSQTLVTFIPALVAFLGVSLLIEAICLVDVVSHTHPFSNLVVAARIKAASYPLGILNYALGIGAVTLLLRRRVGMSLSEAAGAVFVIGLFDLGTLVGVIVLAAALMGTNAPGLQIGIVIAVAAAIVLGFTVLRAPISLGWLDGLRNSRVLVAARTLPLPVLLRLAGLRLVFTANFIALGWAVLQVFGVTGIPVLSLALNICVLLIVAALPIAAAGLGTGQVAFVELFRPWADPATLLAASLTLSFGLIVTRASIGLLFAREFTAEALSGQQEDPE